MSLVIRLYLKEYDMSNTDIFISTRETANLVNVSLRTVYRYIESGKLKTYRIDKSASHKIRLSDLSNLFKKENNNNGKQLKIKKDD